MKVNKKLSNFVFYMVQSHSFISEIVVFNSFYYFLFADKKIQEDKDEAYEILFWSSAVVVFIGFIGLSIFKKKHYRANSHT